MKDNTKIAKILIWVFVIISIVNVFAIYSGYLQYDLLIKAQNGDYATDEESTNNDNREAIVGIIQSILIVISIVLFFIWFRGVYANMSKLEYRTKFRTNMAIWSFIIPFISLYRPYQIMNEIWFETQNLLKKIVPDTKIDFSNYYIGIWWTLFLISNYVGNFTFKAAFKDGTIHDYINSTLAYMFSDFIDILGVIFTILLVNKIMNFETKLYEANKLIGKNIIN